MFKRLSTSLRGFAAIAALTSGLVTSGVAPAAPPPAGPAPTVQGSAYKLLTYNTQFRPAIAELGDDGTAGENKDIYGMKDEDRAKLMVDGILASGAAVVVLQEVFRKEVYNQLVAQLGSTYPFYSDWDDLFADLEGQGSGMIIFSKFPMRSFGKVEERAKCMRKAANDDCTVRFLEYDIQEKVYERVTRKGIGYALLENPHTGRPLHMFFTHFQSTVDAFDARAAQVAEATHFIAEHTSNASEDDIAFLGDMNIRAPDVDGLLPNGNVALEYNAQIAGALGDLLLTDTWMQQSPEDPGFSFDPLQNTATTAGNGSRQRIDYALFRSPTTSKKEIRDACAQHAVLERELFRANTVIDEQDVYRDMSDHFGLSLLVGRDAPQCDPIRAHAVPGGQQTFSRDIVQPGNVQWYRFDEPGTYSLNALANGDPIMRAVAYPANDLSTPLQPIEGSAVNVNRFQRVVYDSNGPFYVRLDFADASKSGAYQLKSKQHRGASFADAIVVGPQETVHSIQMTSNVTQPLNRVHFRIDQRALHSGDSQHHTFGTFALVPLRTTVFNALKQPIPGLETQPGQSPLEALPEQELISGQAQTLFVTVDREGCSSCGEAGFLFQWQTNYREIDFNKLEVVHQAGLFGAGVDRVTVLMSADEGPEVQIFKGELDRYATTRINGGNPVGVVKGVRLRIIEGDLLLDDSAVRDLEYSIDIEGEHQVTAFQFNSGNAAAGLYELDWVATDLGP